jgi:cytochrome b561
LTGIALKTYVSIEMTQSDASYGRVARLFHWIVGLLIIIQLVLGWWMLDLPKTPPGLRAGWFNIHKSIGIVLGLLIFGRIWWRMRCAPPDYSSALATWQRSLARTVHSGLYLCMAVMPLSGYLGSSFTKYPIRFFGYALPNWGWDWPAAKSLLSTVHDISAWLFTVLIILHVLAALFHLIRKDGIFARMWPSRQPANHHFHHERT